MEQFESITIAIPAELELKIVDTEAGRKLHANATLHLGRNGLNLKLKHGYLWKLASKQDVRWCVEDAAAAAWFDARGTLGLIPTEIATIEEFIAAVNSGQQEGGAK